MFSAVSYKGEMCDRQENWRLTSRWSAQSRAYRVRVRLVFLPYAARNVLVRKPGFCIRAALPFQTTLRFGPHFQTS
jgi:hypothetical protein